MGKDASWWEIMQLYTYIISDLNKSYQKLEAVDWRMVGFQDIVNKDPFRQQRQSPRTWQHITLCTTYCKFLLVSPIDRNIDLPLVIAINHRENQRWYVTRGWWWRIDHCLTIYKWSNDHDQSLTNCYSPLCLTASIDHESKVVSHRLMLNIKFSYDYSNIQSLRNHWWTSNLYSA